MKKIILLPVILLICSQLFSQNTPEKCGIETYYDFLEHDYPNVRKTIDAEHQKALDAIRQPSYRSDGVVHTIPIVIHIVYENQDENISDAQVQSQLDVLNTDFRKMNEDASMVPSVFANLVADAEIEFCLATLDPNGNPTTGITRTSTNVSEFGNNNNVKFDNTGGKTPWNASHYLNIWVCDLAGTVLGFATSPGTNAAFDGVVIDYDDFGTLEETATFPHNRGRTATHEVGHYLGLKHIWGDGNCDVDDGISDTPLQEVSHKNCPIFGSPSTITCGSQDMFMNYMDYVDDRCMFMFTTEQVALMRFHLENSRSTLLQSTPIACDPTSGAGCDNLTNSIEMGFEDNEDFEKWTIINANDDSKTWNISEGLNQESGARSGSKCMAYTWSTANNADDWIFSPCFEVRSGTAYKVGFWYATSGDYMEKMKVGFSTSASPDDILGTPIDFGEISQAYNADLPNRNYKEVVLDVPDFGNIDIHIGFQCYSDVEQHSLLIDDIQIGLIVDTEEVIPSDAIDIYPNPVTNHLSVDLNFDKNIEDLSICLININGHTLEQKYFNNYSKGNLSFDLSDVPNGVYMVNIKADKHTDNRKIVVCK